MTDEKLRLFIAVEVPEKHRLWLADKTADLKSDLKGGRWVDVDNQHVTCKFLGWVPSDRLDEIVAATRTVADSHHSADLSLGGLGGFPNERRIRVLWAGLNDDAGLLARVATDLDHAFESLGWAAEDRAFTAHLTLARFKTPVRMREALPVLDASEVEPFTVDRLVLFRSRLSPKGARYEAWKSAPFKAPDTA